MHPRRTNPLPATESEDSMSIAPWAEIVPDAPYPMSQEDYERWPDEDGYKYELVEGRLVRVPNSGFHMRFSAEIFFALRLYAGQHPEWRSFSESTFRLSITDKATGEVKRKTLCPDSSLVLTKRLPPLDNWPAWKTMLELAPDLAVEVASQGQSPAEMAVKAQEFLAGGTRMVWIFYPLLYQGEIWQPETSSPILLSMADRFDGLNVAPGLQLPLRAIFY
jgi:Uma2 family endonuclease